MLIVSASMPKSGSGYVYNILNDLLALSGGVDARLIKERHGLNELFKWKNNYVGTLSSSDLIRLIMISRRDGPFVVKTHEKPNRFGRIMLRLGCYRAIYSYRDPRDVILSALDHARRAPANGGKNGFSHIGTFDDALHEVNSWLTIYDYYLAQPQVLSFRYEDFIADAFTYTRKLCQHVGIQPSDKEIREVLWRYDRSNQSMITAGLHFNKGVSERFRLEMSPLELDKCNRLFGKHLVRMGYAC